MRLLLVEDDVSIQQFLKRALVEAGYQVDTASSAKTGNLAAPRVDYFGGPFCQRWNSRRSP